jgi:peptidoglycan/xylan/chitin deacetylase (PgdA/CDA1 family)
LQEIVDGKRWIEDVIGRPVKAFCYPQGKFNRRTPAMARQAGFVCGRTCMLNRVEFPADRFLWGVSTHAANYRPMIQVRHALLEGNLSGARNFLTVHRAAGDWTVHFRHALRHVQRHGGIAHLYLHTWEIDRNGDWGRLKAAFQEAADSGLTRLDNAQVFEP